ARALRSASGLAIAVAMTVAAPAFAQTNSGDEVQAADDQAATPDRKTIEKAITTANDIVVVGTRASLQSAINRKKQATTVVDSIVADDISSFPDKNIGDSLARITGVQLS